MKRAPLPPNEAERLEKLRRYEILDTLPEDEYDEIVRLVAHICEVPISQISLVDSDRQWFKAAVGLEATETPRERAFCAHTILNDHPMVVEDAAEDERFHDNPLVTMDPKIRFYAGMPLITPDGHRLGALCAIDHRPRRLSVEQQKALETLSRQVMQLLELRLKNREIEAKNAALVEYDRLKTRLMSIMAHDLRRPIINLSSLVQLIRTDEVEAGERGELLEDLNQLLDSTNALLDNVLGWASHQLQNRSLQFGDVVLRELIEQLEEQHRYQLRRKGNRLEIDGGEPAVITADEHILRFVLRNLIANANKFTAAGRISVSWERVAKTQPSSARLENEYPSERSPADAGEDSGGEVVIHVTDTGVGMSPDQLERLFDWAGRATMPGTDGEKGSGLALVLCHDFAVRHGGRIEAASTPGEGSVFSLHLPLTPDAQAGA